MKPLNKEQRRHLAGLFREFRRSALIYRLKSNAIPRMAESYTRAAVAMDGNARGVRVAWAALTRGAK